MIKINNKERCVLEVLAEEWDETEVACYYFRSIASTLEQRIKGGAKLEIMYPKEKSGISQIRRACRSLAKKGLAKFERGIFDQDGMAAGSGYTATRAGASLINPCDICGDLAIFDYDGKLECQEHYGKSTKQYT